MQSQFKESHSWGVSGGVKYLSFQAKMAVSSAFQQMSSSESAKTYGGSQINVMGGECTCRLPKES